MSDSQPSSPAHHHRRDAPAEVPTAVVTVSDTRTLESDTGGALAAELLLAAGHPVVAREIVRDDPAAIATLLRELLAREEVRAVVFTGGTGVAPRDLTPDAVEPLLDRVIPGFGELFRVLSYQEIGSAAILSRAAVRLGLEKLVVPELAHLAGEAVKTR